MVWQSTAPDGSDSTAANVTILQDNTTYIQETMGNSSNEDQDHFWNVDPKSGHHRAVLMQNYSDTQTRADPTDSPNIVDGMTAALYALTVGSADRLYLKNSTSVLMEMLGIQAYAMTNTYAGGGNPMMPLSHNIQSITRTQSGSSVNFVVVFTTQIPTNNYMVIGGGVSAVPQNATFRMRSTGILTETKSTTGFTYTYENGNVFLLPNQLWFICFGG